MKKYFVIMNPVSGTVKPDEISLYLKKYLKDSYQLYLTTGKENIPQIVKDAVKKGASVIIAIGGDGTLSECAEGLLHTEIPLCIVPTGTANNLALELGIPTDSEKAIRLAMKKHRVIAIDAMKADGHYYFLDISIGAKSLVIRDTKRINKLRFGLWAYVIKGIQWMWQFNPRKFTINADGKEATYKAAEVVIANAGIIGVSAFRYSKNAKIDDGILNICIIKANTVIDYLQVAYRFFRNTQTAHDHVQFMTAKQSIQISTKSKLPIQADGEIIGKGKIEVTLVPQSLRVLVPQ